MTNNFKFLIRTLLIFWIVIVTIGGIYLNRKKHEGEIKKQRIDYIYKVDSIAYEKRRDSLLTVYDSMAIIAKKRIKELRWKERKIDSIIKANPKIKIDLTCP